MDAWAQAVLGKRPAAAFRQRIDRTERDQQLCRARRRVVRAESGGQPRAPHCQVQRRIGTHAAASQALYRCMSFIFGHCLPLLVLNPKRYTFASLQVPSFRFSPNPARPMLRLLHAAPTPPTLRVEGGHEVVLEPVLPLSRRLSDQTDDAESHSSCVSHLMAFPLTGSPATVGPSAA